jgi:Lipopolysaccharide kinase (Kdo/WaaP) family
MPANFSINTRSRSSRESLPDFVQLLDGPRALYLHRTIASHAAEIVQRLPAARGAHGEGNRQGVFRLRLAGLPEIVARAGRRGGLARWFLTDLHLGPNPRPLRELQVTLEARRRSIPVAEPMGAIVDWAAPLVYRGFFLTRAMPGMTLAEFLRTDDDPRVRQYVLERAREAIETMHRGGLYHPDLNLHNLFVTKSGENFAIVILDLDKARIFDRPLARGLRRANGRRLLRSARKLDPAGRYLDSAALSILVGDSV